MTPLAFEDGVFADPHLDIQVPGRTAVTARLTLAVQANAIAGIDPGRHRDRKGLFLTYATLTVAAITGVADDLAAPFATRAGLLDGENRLLQAHLALAMAGVAGLGGGPLGSARA